MTVAWSFSAAGAAIRAASTSACEAPGSRGGGGGGAPRPACANTLVEIARTPRRARTVRFIRNLQLASGRILRVGRGRRIARLRLPQLLVQEVEGPLPGQIRGGFVIARAVGVIVERVLGTLVDVRRVGLACRLQCRLVGRPPF